VNLLLDTNALIWWVTGTPMANGVEVDIADPEVPVSVSPVSIWEIAIKQAVGRLRVDGRVIDHVEEGGFVPLPISLAHGERAGGLPLHHKDPFDRMLIAQAQLEGLTIVTRDLAFDAYEVPVRRC
jgi:PIN domain nuclease of toxin-antitoxin system